MTNISIFKVTLKSHDWVTSALPQWTTSFPPWTKWTTLLATKEVVEEEEDLLLPRGRESHPRERPPLS